jgi:excisionase family DNA binding protein
MASEDSVARSLADLIRGIVRQELDQRAAESAVRHLTVSAYAATHSLGKSTVRTAIREGRLPVERIGRAVRVRADAVIAPRAATESATARAERRLGLASRSGR